MDISKCGCDLENKVNSPKYNGLVPLSRQCIYASLFKIFQTVQRIMTGKEAAHTYAEADGDADGISIRNNMSHHPSGLGDINY